MAAAVGLGVCADMKEAGVGMVTRLRRFAPRRKYADILDPRMAHYRTMKAAALAMTSAA